MISPRAREVLERHMAAELAGDIEGVMATLCEHPVYDMYPMNQRIEGRDAVRDMYNNFVFTALFDFDNVGIWYNETSLMREDIVHMQTTNTFLGLTFESPAAFDFRTMSVLEIDVDTIDSDEVLMKGESVLFDAHFLFRQLGIDPRVLGQDS